MILAAKMSCKLKLIKEEDVDQIKNHISKIGLFTSFLQIREKWNMDNLIKHLYKDKKVNNNKLTFILLKNIGKAFICNDVKEELFLETLVQL